MAPRRGARAATLRVGLISDTHGLLRPEALDFLAGSDHIVHAGDVGDAAVLEALAALAPLTAVRGNNDQGAWARRLPLRATLALGGVGILVVHERADLVAAPPAPDVGVVVSGHSHRPAVETTAGVLFVNPGSAGPRRFSLPVALGELRIGVRGADARLFRLGGRGWSRA